MAGSWNVDPEIVSLHNVMVDQLDQEIGSDDVYRLKFLFSRIPLTPDDLSNINNMTKLIDSLMRYETIKYGHYEKLTDKLEKVHKRMRTMVNDYTEKMDKIRERTSGKNPVAYEKTEEERPFKMIRQGDDIQARNQPYKPNKEGARPYQLSLEADNELDDETTDQNLRTEKDWQFYLDWISGKIPDEIGSVATHLSISSEKQKEIEKDNNIVHEKCFHMLWEWFRSRKNDTDRLKALHQALTFADRADMVEVEIQRPAMYQFQSNIIPYPKETLTEMDLLKVSNEIGAHYPSLARYFRINEGEIHASKHDKDGIKNQARDVLLKCFKQTLLQTRQQLCNGLHYKKRRDIIDLLIKRWSSS